MTGFRDDRSSTKPNQSAPQQFRARFRYLSNGDPYPRAPTEIEDQNLLVRDYYLAMTEIYLDLDTRYQQGQQTLSDQELQELEEELESELEMRIASSMTQLPGLEEANSEIRQFLRSNDCDIYDAL